MQIPLDMTPDVFYDYELDFILPLAYISAGSVLEKGNVIPANGCFFQITNLLLNGVRVAYLFSSKYETINRGGFIITFLQKGRGNATKVETLVKHEHLVIYNYPNKGSIAVSPRVSAEVLSVFEAQ